MHIVSCLNLKGGAGKTTTAVNTAAALAELGERVAVLDLDPQQSASSWAPEGLTVVTIENAKSARTVKSKIEELAVAGVTYVLLDCPPELEDRSLTAAMLSHLVLIPTTASPLDLWAAESAVETAKDARAVRGGKLPVVVLVPSRMMTSTVIGRELPAVLKSFGEPVSPGITQRVAITEAVIEHQTIGAYAPGSPGHEDFKQLAQFVKRTIKAIAQVS